MDVFSDEILSLPGQSALLATLTDFIGASEIAHYDVSVDYLMQMHQNHIIKSKSDGHCILHSVATCLGKNVADIVKGVAHQVQSNLQHYVAITGERDLQQQLERYLWHKDYNQNIVDFIIPILCAEYNLKIFILQPKVQQVKIQAIVGSQIPNGKEKKPTAVFLYRSESGAHYDAVIAGQSDTSYLHARPITVNLLDLVQKPAKFPKKRKRKNGQKNLTD